jgi:hypothetical protein
MKVDKSFKHNQILVIKGRKKKRIMMINMVEELNKEIWVYQVSLLWKFSHIQAKCSKFMDDLRTIKEKT